MYVEDILIIGSNSLIEDVVKMLLHLFIISNRGNSTNVLAVEIPFRSDGSFFSQSAYVTKVIQITNMSGEKRTKYPLPMWHPFYEDTIVPTPEDTIKVDRIPFRSILGTILYLSTRSSPDISTAVRMIAKYQSKQTIVYWKMIQHVISYLTGRTDYGILLPNRN